MHLRPLAMALFAASVAVLAACEDDDESGSTTGETHGSLSSCDLTNDVGYCLDFEASAPKNIAQTNCDNAKNTVGFTGVVNATGPCPTTSRVGTCVATITGVRTTYRYFGPRYTTAQAEENCRGLPGGGVFTAN